MRPTSVLAVILMTLYGLLGIVVSVSAVKREPHHRPPPLLVPCYETAVNDTLDAVLLVGADMRTQHPTWQQIESEAARRLHVKRIEPWNRK